MSDDLRTMVQENREEIQLNRGDIKSNQREIQLNRREIKANRKAIESNRVAIGLNGKAIQANGKKIDANGEAIDRLMDKVLEHDGRLDRIERKLETVATKDHHKKVLQTLDTLLGLARKNDQELVFMGKRVGRLEKDVTELQSLHGLA